MQMTEMINVVHQRAGIDSNETANDTLMAVAETLAEREMDGAQENFAAQLPDELSTLINRGEKKNREKFDASEFVNRVGERLGTSGDEAKSRTHAALSTMVEAVSEGEQVDLMNALPNDFTPYSVWNT